MTTTDMNEFLELLPPDLRGTPTSIVPIHAGFSHASVFRVESPGVVFVLKMADGEDSLEHWLQTLEIRRRAASAGLTPRIIHWDVERRAVLSEFVEDRSFPRLYGHPDTRGVAIELLARLLRKTHELPVPDDRGRVAGDLLLVSWEEIAASKGIPRFARESVERMLREAPPESDRGPVLSHNDVNPTNLIYDGEHLLLLDWDVAGRNEPYYDLAAAALFLLMDESTVLSLLSAYDGNIATAVPPRLVYDRQLVAAMAGSIFLRMAIRNGYESASGNSSAAARLSLGGYYRAMAGGHVDPATPEGQWKFGLALLGEVNVTSSEGERA